MKKILLPLFAIVLIPYTALSFDSYKIMTKIKKDTVEKISTDSIVSAIKEQNIKHKSLSEEEIITMDKQWRAEKKSADRPLIDSTLNNDVSKVLTKIRNDSDGFYTEIFIMDNKGLNVGQSDITSDYWQGDEDKWQKTYLKGPKTFFMDKVEYDKSSGKIQTQVNMTISDPKTGLAIGAITYGVYADQ